MKQTSFPILLAAATLAVPLAGFAADGPDLTGTIEAPASGEAGLAIEIPITIANIGSQAASTFGFRITIDPDEMEDGTEPIRHSLVYAGDVEGGLPAGDNFTTVIHATLPSPIRGDFYTFELEIDGRRVVSDVDRSNNTVYSPAKMKNLKPAMSIRTWSLTLPDGCFYGEPIEATIETCSSGRAQALNFLPGVVMGELEQMTLIEDVPAATFPQSCLSPEHPNYNACAPFQGQTPSCVEETCRLSCEEDADCGDKLFCRDDPILAAALGEETAKSCINYLSFPPNVGDLPKCRTFSMQGKIPVANQQGIYYRNQKQRFHLITDVTFSLSESRPYQIATDEYLCQEALPDLAPSSLTPKLRMVAGEATPIARVIKNLGFIEHPRVVPPVPVPASMGFEYQYYLSTAPDISVNQIPLVIMSTGGMGVATIGRKGEHALTDLVMIPANTAPGDYYIGLIADPKGKVRELSKSNNVLVFPDKVRVEIASLQIVTDSLPIATLGARFTHQLVAQGGIGPYQWTATSELPPGIVFGADGMLSGIPSDVGLFTFTVKVTSGDHVTERMLVLQTIPPQGSLEITTKVLPPAVRNAVYGGWVDEFNIPREGLPLAASGGMRPYEWSLDPSVEDNYMPQGLELVSPDGIVRGTPSTQSETREVVVLVRDQLGNVATRSLRIVVVSSADLVIVSQLFAEGTTAQGYDSCIEATGGDRSASYEWSLDPTTIPPGLHAETRNNQACLVGTPSACANYMVRASVSDVGGQTYSATVPLSVECDVIQLTTRFLPTVSRGQVVEQQLASNAGEGVSYRLFQGSLPGGLSLAEDGLISGTVAGDAAFGGYNFIVQLRDAAGKQGLSALSMTVKIEPREVSEEKTTKGSNCAAAGGGASGALPGLALLGLALLGRRGARRDGKELS